LSVVIDSEILGTIGDVDELAIDRAEVGPSGGEVGAHGGGEASFSDCLGEELGDLGSLIFCELVSLR